MSQDVSPSQIFLNTSLEGGPASSWGESVSEGTESGSLFVESYADRLMNELFDDVERMLDGVVKAPAKPPRTEPKAVEAPPTLAGSLVPVTQTLAATDSAPTAAEFPVLSTPGPTAPITPANPVPARLSSSTYDRLLLGVGCISVIVTLALWLLSQETKRPPAPVPVAVQNQVPANPADVRFVDYLQQSLQNLAQTAPSQASQSVAIAPNTSPSPNSSLPTVAIPGTPVVPGRPTINRPNSTTPGRSPSGLERIYVPVYQLPPNLKTSRPNLYPTQPRVAPLPGGTSGSTAVRSPVPLSVPGVARTLVGVVELGENSVILVEINGVAQRFRLGESIGSSGWTLVEVAKSQAIIRRNGEVKSIFIGQSF